MDASNILPPEVVKELVPTQRVEPALRPKIENQDAQATQEQLRRLQAAVKDVPKMTQNSTNVQISFDEESRNYVITITNQVTGQVIRQIPPEQIRHAMAYIAKLSGLNLDQTA